MGKGGNSKKDKFFYFCETWIIFIIITLFILITTLNYLFDFDSGYQDFIEVTLGKSLDNLKGSLLSIAAIFIGVYVTVFTLLGSIKVDSVFAYLNENTFKKLIDYIRNAFIASFGYLVLIMILEVSFNSYNEFYFWLIVLNTSIVIYMFLTAFRFGIILYISFSKDLNDLQKNIKIHKEEQREIEELRYKMGRFLDEFEKEQSNKQNEKMSKVINEDEKR